MGIPRKMILVFGSNDGGIHGAGAARYALQHFGAQFGKSYGHYGDSFAIPTKNIDISESLPIGRIHKYVLGFQAYASGHPKMNFKVTAIGCGLAGFHHRDIAPLFKGSPPNCYFDKVWHPYLGDDVKYWGSYDPD